VTFLVAVVEQLPAVLLTLGQEVLGATEEFWGGGACLRDNTEKTVRFSIIAKAQMNLYCSRKEYGVEGSDVDMEITWTLKTILLHGL